MLRLCLLPLLRRIDHNNVFEQPKKMRDFTCYDDDDEYDDICYDFSKKAINDPCSIPTSSSSVAFTSNCNSRNWLQ